MSEVLKDRVVTEGRLKEVYSKIMREYFPEGIKIMLGPVKARVAALEKQVQEMEASAGVTIRADHVDVPGMQNVAALMGRLDATLRSPMKPVYNEKGILVGARREVDLGAAPSAFEALEARVKALEERQR